MELRFRDEFQLNKLCLTFDEPEAFGSSQWRWPRPVFVVYRLVAASYVIGWNIYGYITIPTFGHHVTIVFYTNWSYLVLALHLTLALLVTIYHSARRKMPPEVGEGSAQARSRPGSHVITICGGTCAELPGSVLHYHLQECGQGDAATAKAAGKRKQKAALVHNNNEYKVEDKRASRCRGIAESTGGEGQARVKPNGAPGVGMGVNAAGKKRSKSKVRGHNPDYLGSREGKVRGRRYRSVGVNCGLGNGHQEYDPSHGNHGNRSHDLQIQPMRTKPDGAPRHLAGATDNREKLRCHKTKSTSRHQIGVGRENAELHLAEETIMPSGGRERKHRRRKVCHRRGKTVAFKCRSSNSSLDKIRSRVGRRLTPEVKRRGRRSPRNGARVDDHLVIGNRPTPAPTTTAGGAGRTWQQDVERADMERACVDPVTSYRRDAGGVRSRHRRSGSKTHRRRISVLESEEGVVGLHRNFFANDSENRRLAPRSKSKGKHTFILQRSSGGAPRKVTIGEEQRHAIKNVDPQEEPSQGRISLAQQVHSNNQSEGNRATRSIGTNTSQAELPQRISVIVENPNTSLPQTLDVVAPVAQSQERQAAPELPLYIKISWVIFNMAAGSAPVVSSVYFFILFPMLQREQPSFQANILDINLHGINSLIILLELTVSAFPVRILHCVYPLAYGLTYVIFSVAYWGLDKENNILYPVILDWNHPAVTIPVVIGLVGFATPLLQLLWYGVYRLRLYLYNRIYHTPTAPSNQAEESTTPPTRKETQV